MAGSFMTRLRERMEQLQTEMQPEAGFNRRAYGYEDEADGGDDATFEEVALEEESPWRRPGSGEARAAPAAPAPEVGQEESPWRRDPPSSPRPVSDSEARGAEAPPPPPHAPARSPTRAARADRFDPFRVRERQTGGGVPRATPSPPSREAPGRAPASPAAGGRSTPREFERRAGRGAGRLQRLRRRIRNPESLRELFLLREVIDRPIALRRPRPRR